MRCLMYKQALIRRHTLLLGVITPRPPSDMATSKNQKPEVCIVVSGSSPSSRSSTHLGAYLGGNLALAGHVRVSLVSLPPAPNSKASNNGPYVLTPPLSVMQHGTEQRVKVEDDMELSAPVSALSSACIIVVCVDSADTPQCLKLIHDSRGKATASTGTGPKTNKNNKALGIISLQRGVKNSAQVADSFSYDRSVTVLEGAVGLEVVQDAVDGCVVCLNPRARLVVERLNRDKAQTGGIMVDVLETSGVPILFRHNLTTHTWGITSLHTSIGAVNALTGKPLAQDLLYQRCSRLVCAALLRECRLALAVMSRDNKWAPCLESCTGLSLLWIERLLTLPTPLYTLVAPLFLPLTHNLPSPAQADLHAGLETDVVERLRELQGVGKQANSSMAVLSGVLDRLRGVAEKKEGVVAQDPALLYRELGSPSASSGEVAKLTVQLLSMLTLLLGLLWLLWR